MAGNDINITILSPVPDNISDDWYGSFTYKKWNISVSTNATADSCRYEFGIREDYWVTPPIYYSITSTGALNKLNNTYFQKLNVDPLGDHNYLKVYCNNSNGTVFNQSIHAEIDRVSPGTITDLKVLFDKDLIAGYLDLEFTWPGDDGYNLASRIRYMDIKRSNTPINASNFDSIETLNSSKTWCYYPSYTNYTEAGTKVRCTVIGSEPYKADNGSIIKNNYYFAIKLWDNVGWESNMSNVAYNYTPWYECSLEALTFKKKNTTAPFPSNLSRTYSSPWGNNPQVPYETLYNGDEIFFSVRIKNLGDGKACKYYDYNGNILGQGTEIFNLSYNEQVIKNYNWTVSTASVQNYHAQLYAKDAAFLGGDYGRNFRFDIDLYGINFSRYASILSLPYSQYEVTTNPGDIPFFIQNSLWTGIPGLILDHGSFKWVPVKMYYTKAESWYTNLSFSGFDTGTNSSSPYYSNYMAGLPQEFYNYSCQAPYNNCMKPFVKYSTVNAEAGLAFKVGNLEPGGEYYVWATAGIYPEETVTSSQLTVYYMG